MGTVLLTNSHLKNHHFPRKMAIPQKELEEAFKLFDCDGDGNITASELKALIEKVGGNITDGEATALIRQADRDGNGHLDKTEFTKLDADNSGFITKDEMLSIINSTGTFKGDQVEEAQKCVAALDVDQDGRVSYPEFLLVWK